MRTVAPNEVELSGASRHAAAEVLAALGQHPELGELAASIAATARRLDQGASEELAEVLRSLLDAAAEGRHLLVADEELTSGQAAVLLGVSRTYLVRLADAGLVPCARLGSHRRFRASDVLAFRRQRAGLPVGASAGGADEPYAFPFVQEPVRLDAEMTARLEAQAATTSPDDDSDDLAIEESLG